MTNLGGNLTPASPLDTLQRENERKTREIKQLEGLLEYERGEHRQTERVYRAANHELQGQNTRLLAQHERLKSLLWPAN
jgi:hypothetical protein